MDPHSHCVQPTTAFRALLRRHAARAIVKIAAATTITAGATAWAAASSSDDASVINACVSRGLLGLGRGNVRDIPRHTPVTRIDRSWDEMACHARRDQVGVAVWKVAK
jgi:hypothetical protein